MMKEKEAQAARKDDIKKEHPNVHFAKKKSMEIYVAKDYNIAPPSAGSLNLDKEDTSPGREVPVSKNSAYVKNLIT